jgi:signal transduction histidine kinase
VTIISDLLNHPAFAGFGLQGMRERATRIGATLTLVSAPASGTELAVVVGATRVFSSPSIHNP